MTPGGGSAAAVTAALGVALLEMTVGINQERKPEKKSLLRLKKIKKFRLNLLKLASEDAKTFLKFSKVRKKAKNSFTYQNAVKRCAQIPLEICRQSARALKTAQDEMDRTSRWLSSDLAESALLLHAAFQAARWNAEINLKMLSDRNLARKLESQIHKLEGVSLRSRNKVMKGLGY